MGRESDPLMARVRRNIGTVSADSAKDLQDMQESWDDLKELIDGASIAIEERFAKALGTAYEKMADFTKQHPYVAAIAASFASMSGDILKIVGGAYVLKRLLLGGAAPAAVAAGGGGLLGGLLKWVPGAALGVGGYEGAKDLLEHPGHALGGSGWEAFKRLMGEIGPSAAHAEEAPHATMRGVPGLGHLRLMARGASFREINGSLSDIIGERRGEELIYKGTLKGAKEGVIAALEQWGLDHPGGGHGSLGDGGSGGEGAVDTGPGHGRRSLMHRATRAPGAPEKAPSVLDTLRATSPHTHAGQRALLSGHIHEAASAVKARLTGSGPSHGWWTAAREEEAYNYLRKEVGLSDAGAKGMVARWAYVESTGRGTGDFNLKGGGHFGIGQWSRARGGSMDLLKKSLGEQLGLFKTDLDLPEQAIAKKTLMDAKTSIEGAIGAAQYERAEGYQKAHPERGDNWVNKTLNGMASFRSDAAALKDAADASAAAGKAEGVDAVKKVVGAEKDVSDSTKMMLKDFSRRGGRFQAYAERLKKRDAVAPPSSADDAKAAAEQMKEDFARRGWKVPSLKKHMTPKEVDEWNAAHGGPHAGLDFESA